MKKVLKILIIVGLIIFFKSPTMAYAEEANPTETIIAGAEVVMRENMEILGYKELMRISNLMIVDPVQYMVEYDRILEIYSPYMQTQTLHTMFSEEDINYLERCVETETFGGDDFLSKVNVANVILNRVKDEEKFPSTIKEVITASGQFTYGKSRISPLTIAACEYAAVNADTTNGALYFHSGKMTTTFNKAEYMFTDASGHHYYK